MKSILFIFIALMAAVPVKSQDFTLAVYYLHGEKSKDSHSTEESIVINGDSVVYSVNYKGKFAGDRAKENIICSFTGNETEKIKSDIINKGLNKNDTLFADLSKSKSYEVYCNIIISISMDGNSYTVKINGDVNEFTDSELYSNAVSLISGIRILIMECK